MQYEYVDTLYGKAYRVQYIILITDVCLNMSGEME